MNRRAQSPSLATPRRAWFCLTLLLPALATEVAQSNAPPVREDADAYPFIPDEEMRPYLPAVGAPQLRFLEAIPPPDVSARPPPGAPPSSAEKTRQEIQRSPSTIAPASPAAPVVAARREEKQTESAAVPARPAAQPPAILPDDAGRKVRPEDFLPFFPASGPGVTANDMNFIPPSPPGPGRQPPSTATYRQQ